jgi:ketosteroid isomerase-like protein
VDEVLSLLDRFNAAWNAHDLDAAMSMCTDDIVFESTGPAPDGERAEGQAAVRESWTPIFANARSHFEQEDVVAAGDRLVQRWRYTWGDGHIRGVDVFAVRDGKIAEKLAYVKG